MDIYFRWDIFYLDDQNITKVMKENHHDFSFFMGGGGESIFSLVFFWRIWMHMKVYKKSLPIECSDAFVECWCND